jgi:hypothetical protein
VRSGCQDEVQAWVQVRDGWHDRRPRLRCARVTYSLAMPPRAAAPVSTPLAGTIDTATAHDGFGRGATIVVNEIEKLHEPVMDLAKSIEARAPRNPTQPSRATPKATNQPTSQHMYIATEPNASSMVPLTRPPGRRRRSMGCTSPRTST